jgi:hypothetical protein
LLWDSERKRLANAVVNVIGKLDEINGQIEEITLNDFNYFAVQAELWHGLQDALDEMPKRTKPITQMDAVDMPLSDINPDCLPKAILEKSGMPILNENEISLLARFKETSEDDSSYDLSADELKRLAQYGALKHNGGGYYSITEIGQWLLSL